MRKKGLIVVMEEGSGRILAVRLTSLRRLDYEFEQLTDYFQLGASEEFVPLHPISQTFAIRLKRPVPRFKIHTDQDVAFPAFPPSSQPLP